MEKKLLALEGLSKYYTGAQQVVMGLNSISVSFDRGEFVAITGESGSGKSTLAHVLGGILPYEAGEMYYDGKPTSHFDGADYERYRRDNISFISQSYGILPGSSVLENVVSALRLTGMEKREARAKAREILREVELWELKNRRAAKLSSGQKQRLSIARALAKPAPILIADEPTGNLDPENSAKVIKLLARAARERLVILITHEFQEAADHVTRHIVIQEGRIAMDQALAPKEEPEPAAGQSNAARRKVLSPYIAGLQMGGRPVWSTLVLLFFALTAFAVFAFLGTFIVHLDDTDTRVYDNSAFFNGDPLRILLAKEDVFTDRDYEALLGVEYVTGLERYGYVSDISYGYREGVDYDMNHDLELDPETGEYIMIEIPMVRESAPFIRTVPLLPPGREFLTAGRLPENAYEVVLAGGEELLGTTMTVYLHDYQNWGVNVLMDLEVTVVGVTDYGEGLYFCQDLGRGFSYMMEGSAYRRHGYSETYGEYLLLPSAELQGNQIRPNADLYDGYTHSYLNGMREDAPTMELLNLNQPVGRPDALSADSYVQVEFIFSDQIPAYHESLYARMMEVSPELFEQLTPAGSGQVAVYIEDYAYTDRVLDALQDLGYVALSPYQQGSTRQDQALAEERMQTLTVCVLALLAVVLLQVIVLRALFGAQRESYAVLSNMGLTCGMAKRSILWQILFFTVLGQGLGFGAILACREYGVERIVHLMRYLLPEYIAILSAVHLAASLVAAWWIARALGKQVYPLAGRQSDLQFEEKEA